MKKQLQVPISRQPDDVTCGPTCLHGIYEYFELGVSLEAVLSQVRMLPDGGTLAVNLGLHAIRQGLEAKIYTFNLNIFDPTWFKGSPKNSFLIEKLEAQLYHKSADDKLVHATKSYIKFLNAGGSIDMKDLTLELLHTYLSRDIPILTGLSATYLYQSMRDVSSTNQPDDVQGYPAGHFVVLSGIDLTHSTVTVSDPYRPNPISSEPTYKVSTPHLICSILLGSVTYDANFLVVSNRCVT